MKVIKTILLFIIISLATLSVSAKVIEDRSALSKMIELTFRVNQLFQKDYTDESAEAYLNEKAKENEPIYDLSQDYDIPLLNADTSITESHLNGMRVFEFKPTTPSGDVLIYLHGGAYVSSASSLHFRFVDKLASETNLTVYLPLYPLAPLSNAEEVFPLMHDFYDYLTNQYNNHNLFIMGDSAGGGLALGFTLDLLNLEKPLPDKIILNAPWLDLELDNEAVELAQQKDPFLNNNNAKYLGDAWRNGLDVLDYRVSPIHGDFTGLPETLLFIGTYDILHPDALLFKEKANADGVDLTFIEGDKMLHVYPLYPFMKEAKDAFDTLTDFLLTE